MLSVRCFIESRKRPCLQDGLKCAVPFLIIFQLWISNSVLAIEAFNTAWTKGRFWESSFHPPWIARRPLHARSRSLDLWHQVFMLSSWPWTSWQAGINKTFYIQISISVNHSCANTAKARNCLIGLLNSRENKPKALINIEIKGVFDNGEYDLQRSLLSFNWKAFCGRGNLDALSEMMLSITIKLTL